MRARDEKGDKRSLDVLGGIAGINSQTIKLIQHDKAHHLLPIRQQTIDLGDVANRWFQSPEGYALFASKLRNDFGEPTDHATQTEYVLLLAQLESVAKKAGLDHGKRYEEAIRMFGGPGLVDQVISILGVTALTDAGSKLSELRAEIAHFSKPRKILPIIGLQKFVALNRCLDLVIASCIYQNLGIKQQVIEEFRTQELRGVEQFLEPPSR